MRKLAAIKLLKKVIVEAANSEAKARHAENGETFDLTMLNAGFVIGLLTALRLLVGKPKDSSDVLADGISEAFKFYLQVRDMDKDEPADASKGGDEQWQLRM